MDKTEQKYNVQYAWLPKRSSGWSPRRPEKESDIMINDEIKKVREKLNIMIENREQAEQIYEVSKELDELIIKFYREQI